MNELIATFWRASRRFTRLSGLAALALMLGLAGCANKGATSPKPGASTPAAGSTADRSLYKKPKMVDPHETIILNSDPGKPPPDLSNISDPCANQLQELQGAILFFYAQFNRLPYQLTELAPAPGSPPLALSCPASNKAYVYNRTGIINADTGAKVIVYDAAPSHLGYRWAIVIKEQSDDAIRAAEERMRKLGVVVPKTEARPSLLGDVVLLPEKFFLLQPPK